MYYINKIRYMYIQNLVTKGSFSVRTQAVGSHKISNIPKKAIEQAGPEYWGTLARAGFTRYFQWPFKLLWYKHYFSEQFYISYHVKFISTNDIETCRKSHLKVNVWQYIFSKNRISNSFKCALLVVFKTCTNIWPKHSLYWALQLPRKYI